MSVTFQPMDEACAQVCLAWRYDPPYDIYNVSSDQGQAAMQALLDPRNAYYCMMDERQELVAYCCFGLDARVPGGDYGDDALDIGLGVRPDLTGQGRGRAFTEAVLTFAVWNFSPAAFRVTVAEFNQRAQRVWQKAGFQPVQVFARYPDGMAFVIMAREV